MGINCSWLLTTNARRGAAPVTPRAPGTTHDTVNDRV